MLDMESCIEAMEEALAALARDELSMPLRFVVRPDGEQLLGLMPAHRGGTNAAVLAQGDRDRARERERAGSTRTRAPCSSTTERRACCAPCSTPPRSPRSARQRSPRSRRSSSPARTRAGRDPRLRRPGALARARRCATVLADAELRVWSRTPAHAEALALEAHAVVCATVEEALDGADVVCTCTSAREPIVRRAWLAPGAHVNAVGSSVPSARELEAAVVADGVALRRPAGVDAQRVRRLPAGGRGARASGPTTSAPSSGELLVGAHPGRTSNDELTVFKSLGLAVEDLAAAALVRRTRPRASASASRCRSDRARGDRARARGHRGRRRRDAARAPRCRRALRDLAQARVPPADRLVQAARRVERDPPGDAPSSGATASGRRARGTWRRASRGSRASSGVPATVVAPDHAPRAKLDAIERLGGRVDRPLRPLVGDDGGGRLPRARRALRPPGAGRARDGRQRRHRARARRAARRDRPGARALGRRWALDRDRQRARSASRPRRA